MKHEQLPRSGDRQHEESDQQISGRQAGQRVVSRRALQTPQRGQHRRVADHCRQGHDGHADRARPPCDCRPAAVMHSSVSFK